MSSERTAGRHKPVANTYRRPVKIAWWSDPCRARYMAREMTSICLIAYALVLLFGLWRLSQGQVAFDAWRAALSSPLAIVGHGVILAGAVYHTISWFEVMPRTLPDSKLPPERITRAGWAAAAVVTVVVLVFVIGGGR